MDLSLSCDHMVINGPAELNALSVSTDVGGKVFMNDIFQLILTILIHLTG